MPDADATTPPALTDAMAEPWPALPLEPWRDTYATLHMWTQVVGKIVLALTPLTNHFWNIAFNKDLSEFILPYEAVRTSATPAIDLTDFLASTYDAAANLAGWNRAELERTPRT